MVASCFPVPRSPRARKVFTMSESADKLQTIGRGAFDSIAEMVAALESPYDRENTPETLIRDTLALPATADDADDDNPFAPLTDEQWEEGLESLNESDPEDRKEAARERIEEDPLSVQVRSAWENSPEDFDAAEFCILLSTGGPATRIVGELDRGEPISARLEAQDWFTPWEALRTTTTEEEILLAYCRCFCFEY